MNDTTNTVLKPYSGKREQVQQVVEPGIHGCGSVKGGRISFAEILSSYNRASFFSSPFQKLSRAP
jgi:hypothetical protein